MKPLRLGVNIDHVATLRNARGGIHPDPVRAALQSVNAGADSITAHLREDRRHIRDADIWQLKQSLPVPLNFEMAATEEMQRIALAVKPHACCLVPEKREERTTEGGLDVSAHAPYLKNFIAPLCDAGIRVSMFVDPIKKQIEASKSTGAQAVELHTGTYCEASAADREKELGAIRASAKHADELGLECHAGHGLSFDNVFDIAAISHIIELNIGHFLMGEALYFGLDLSIQKMRRIMNEARLKECA